jgi:small subunit ribosomal protein S6
VLQNGKVRNHADYQRRSRRGKFKSLIEANGTIDSIDEWGKRRLAYPINDEEEGVYTVIDFTSEPSFPAELDRVYKITEGVMRSLIIAHEE